MNGKPVELHEDDLDHVTGGVGKAAPKEALAASNADALAALAGLLDAPPPISGVKGAGAPPSIAWDTALLEMANTIVLPNPKGVDTSVMLVELAASLRDVGQSGKEQITADQDLKKSQISDKASKLEEAETKIQEAKDKQSHASLADKVMHAYQWIGAIASIEAANSIISSGSATIPKAGQQAASAEQAAMLEMLKGQTEQMLQAMSQGDAKFAAIVDQIKAIVASRTAGTTIGAATAGIGQVPGLPRKG